MGAFMRGPERTCPERGIPPFPIAASRSQRLESLSKDLLRFSKRSYFQRAASSKLVLGLGRPGLDCYWVGFLEFKFSANKGVFY